MVINLLKKFLHELPDALLSSVLYQRYISAVRTFIYVILLSLTLMYVLLISFIVVAINAAEGDDAARLAYLVALLNSLAPSSRSLLRRLLIYLRNVVAHRYSFNLSILF
jgi:hypothetical protein